jgi:hypothetical protein
MSSWIGDNWFRAQVRLQLPESMESFGRKRTSFPGALLLGEGRKRSGYLTKITDMCSEEIAESEKLSDFSC